jgi:hypothetical protein
MLKSINDAQKLFRLQRLAGGKVDVEATPYLLSLSERKQREVLRSQLALLQKDISKIKNMSIEPALKNKTEIEQAQLQLLIQVVEGLLHQISKK